MLHDVRVPDFDLPDRPMRLTLWMAKLGRLVEVEQPIAEILAGEVLIELPSPATGTLEERLVEVDEPIEPGQVIGRLETEL
jgi:pyruvate/2-oxoglutarate dehydrogenase complex dihydrolipoamide acyltransferase (E2) component